MPEKAQQITVVYDDYLALSTVQAIKTRCAYWCIGSTEVSATTMEAAEKSEWVRVPYKRTTLRLT